MGIASHGVQSIYVPKNVALQGYLRFAIVQRTMAEVGVGRPTARARARALVLESTEIISQVRALIQTNL